MSMSRTIVRTAIATVLLAGVMAQAHASLITIATGGTGSVTPPGSPDSFTLNATTSTYNVPAGVPTTVNFQTGTFNAVYSPYDNVTFPFSFTENVTINGNTQSVLFTGGINVTYALDTLTFNTGAVQNFGGMSVQFQPLSLSVPANTQGGFRFTQQAIIKSVPEPATLGLLGLGLAAIGFSRRRKTA